MNYFIIGLVVVLIVLVALFFLGRYQRKNMDKLFSEVYQSSKQVPKQKRNSFLLLMFKEAIAASKSKKKTDNMGKFNNPKYLEVQLLQMSNILKDKSAVKDKQMKRAIRLYDDYLRWEKEKNKPSTGKKTA